MNTKNQPSLLNYITFVLIIVLCYCCCLTSCIPTKSLLHATSNPPCFKCSTPRLKIVKDRLKDAKNDCNTMIDMLRDMTSLVFQIDEALVTCDDNKLMELYPRLKRINDIEPPLNTGMNGLRMWDALPFGRPSEGASNWGELTSNVEKIYADLYHSFHHYALAKILATSRLKMIDMRKDAIQFAEQYVKAESFKIKHFSKSNANINTHFSNALQEEIRFAEQLTADKHYNQQLYKFARMWSRNVSKIQGLQSSFETRKLFAICSSPHFIKKDAIHAISRMFFDGGAPFSQAAVNALTVFIPEPEIISVKLSLQLNGESNEYHSFKRNDNINDISKLNEWYSWYLRQLICGHVFAIPPESPEYLPRLTRALKDIQNIEPTKVLPPLESLPLKVPYKAYKVLHRAFYTYKIVVHNCQHLISDFKESKLVADFKTAVSSGNFGANTVSTFLNEMMDIDAKSKARKKEMLENLALCKKKLPSVDPRSTPNVPIMALSEADTVISEKSEKDMEIKALRLFPEQNDLADIPTTDQGGSLNDVNFLNKIGKCVLHDSYVNPSSETGIKLTRQDGQSYGVSEPNTANLLYFLGTGSG